MTANIKDIVHTLVKRSVDSVADSDAKLIEITAKYDALVRFARWVADKPNGANMERRAYDILRLVGEDD